MTDRSIDWRCGILDLLEAAAMHAGVVDVRRGNHWQLVTVRDVISSQGEDWLVTTAGERLAVSEIDAVRPVRVT